MPQIRRNLCTIRKSPLLVFSRLFVAIQSNGHGSPGSVFLTFFPPGVLNWNLAVLWALCCRTKREKREEGNATCEPVAHQLTIAASCPGLTPFHTHKTGCITALITRAAWTNAVRHLSLHWPLLLPGAIDLGHSLQIRWPALGLSLFGILLHLPLPYFSRSCSPPRKWHFSAPVPFLQHLSKPPPPHPPLAQRKWWQERNPLQRRSRAALALLPARHGADTRGVFQDRATRLHWCKNRPGLKLWHTRANTSTVSFAPDGAARVTVVIYQLSAPNKARICETWSPCNLPVWRGGGDSPTKAVLVQHPVQLCDAGTFRSHTTALGLHQRDEPDTLVGTYSPLSKALGKQDAGLNSSKAVLATGGGHGELCVASAWEDKPWSCCPPPSPRAAQRQEKQAPSFQLKHPALKSLITFLFFTQSTEVWAHILRDQTESLI